MMQIKSKLIKKTLIKLLKASKQQFYDEEGKPISVEEYVNILLKQDLNDALEYQKKIENDKRNIEQ